MKILVCIKQVPDVQEIELDKKTFTINRSKASAIINPYDLYAIEEALILKEKFYASTTVITMGPPSSEDALREAISRGIDEAYLITDPLLAGSDTFATSFTLYNAIKQIGDFDLILCGKKSLDGETAQVGPQLASFLGIPVITSVTKIIEIVDHQIFCEALTTYGIKIIKVKLPALLTISRPQNEPRLISLRDLYRGYNTIIKKINVNELGLSKRQVGLKGSLTKVKKVEVMNFTKKCNFLNGDLNNITNKLIEILKNKKKNENFVSINVLNENEIELDKKVFIIGEIFKYKITKSTYQLVFIANKLATKLKATVNLILFTDSFKKIENLNNLPVVNKLYIFENNAFRFFDSYIFKEILIDFLYKEKPLIILATSSYEGRELMPQLAASLKAGLTADCIQLEIEKDGKLLQIRPTFGGNILATIENKDTFFQMATIRENSFPITKGGIPSSIIINKIEKKLDSKINIINFEEKKIGRESDIIIAGGRGIGSKENFNLIFKIANILKAEVGASRAAVDAHWIDYTYQIGQTGRVVKPAIYIACGISGAVQHLSGILNSAIIIAINKDKNANIFKIADYGIVEDYKLILTHLLKALKR